MEKKLQVFISSTYTDLIVERQAAVEAVLNAGHIPAGMELFSSGNDSQLETIHRWIEESDIYLLILGGRYGSIEEKSGLSYTQLEYEYAENKRKPLFAVVISDEALENKVRESGQNVLELKNRDKYEAFKKKVTKKICRFFKDEKDIKLSILESLNDIQKRFKLSGWIPGSEIDRYINIENENINLLKENVKLNKLNLKLTTELNKKSTDDIPDEEYNKIVEFLKKKQLKNDMILKGKNISLLEIFLKSKDILALGVCNRYDVEQYEIWLYHNVIPELMVFDFMEEDKVPSRVMWKRFKLSKKGLVFLRRTLCKIL